MSPEGRRGVQAASRCVGCGVVWPLPISEVMGSAAKRSFHSRGVSCATSFAGWLATRWSTSTSQVQGSTPWRRQVAMRLWMIPTCSAPSSVQQNSQLRRPMGMTRSARSRWLFREPGYSGMASEVGGARAFRCDFSGIITNCAIPLRRDSIAALEAWREECGREPCSPVFVNRHGRPLTHDSLAYLLNRNLEVARRNAPSLQGKRVTPHTLRHTAAMELLHNDVDRATIALWLGHESVETAYIYLHSDLQPKERAMARTSPLDLPVRTYRPDEAVPGLLNSLRLFRKNHTERPACQGLPKPFRNNRVPGITRIIPDSE